MPPERKEQRTFQSAGSTSSHTLGAVGSWGQPTTGSHRCLLQGCPVLIPQTAACSTLAPPQGRGPLFLNNNVKHFRDHTKPHPECDRLSSARSPAPLPPSWLPHQRCVPNQAERQTRRSPRAAAGRRSHHPQHPRLGRRAITLRPPRSSQQGASCRRQMTCLEETGDLLGTGLPMPPGGLAPAGLRGGMTRGKAKAAPCSTQGWISSR